MRLLTFQYQQDVMAGVLDGDTILPLPWPDVKALIESGLDAATEAAAAAHGIPLNQVTLRAPILKPGKIVAVGLNYLDHCLEQGKTPPQRPTLFTKFSTAVNHPGGLIRWEQALTQQVDYEAELAVVIGKRARRVSEADAYEYVAGYTCLNDITARDIQRDDKQWVRGKSLDTFAPMGPVIVTRDEIPDPHTLAIRCWVNGELRQQSNTNQLIHTVPKLIAFCSRTFTLEPGDIITTGTPGGVGIFNDPPIALKPGDEIVMEIESIGRLHNRVGPYLD
jgi:2-keto-4-pentenoate hydratase/2-oxohepta-3-ene-1,7-dioic acid hydratase in catechol pathway